MLVFRKIIYRCVGISAGFLAVAWLLPQTLFGGCVRAVLPGRQEGYNIEEKEYEELFRLEEDNYKIVWKFMQKD